MGGHDVVVVFTKGNEVVGGLSAMGFRVELLQSLRTDVMDFEPTVWGVDPSTDHEPAVVHLVELTLVVISLPNPQPLITRTPTRHI
jgi:hypothetical protein